MEAAAATKSLQLCPTLCDPIDGSPPGFLIPGMKVKSESEVAESCPTLSNLMDCSPPGCSVHGIFQARVLEWGAIAFSELWKLGTAFLEQDTICYPESPLPGHTADFGLPSFHNCLLCIIAFFELWKLGSSKSAVCTSSGDSG